MTPSTDHVYVQIGLSSDERELLLEQIPNEVLNGIGYDKFEASFGISLQEYVNLAKRLRAETGSCRRIETGSLRMPEREVRLIIASLRGVLDDLESEFQTRTGHYEAEVENLLQRLQHAIDTTGDSGVDNANRLQ